MESIHYNADNFSKIGIMEHLAKQKTKHVMFSRIANGLLIVAEYLIYLLSFLILYRWKVSRVLTIVDPATWLSSSNIFVDYSYLFAIIMVIHTIRFYSKGMFTLRREKFSLLDDLFEILKTLFFAFLIAIGIIFYLKTSIYFSRLLVAYFAISIVVIALIFRAARSLVTKYLSRLANYSKNVLIVGAGRIGEEIYQYLTTNKAGGLRFAGYLDDYKNGDGVIGKTADLEKVIIEKNINEVYITIPSEREKINYLLSKVRKYDVEIKIIPELFEFVASSIQLHKLADFPYLEVIKTPLRGMNAMMKRLVDIALSCIALILLLPVLVVTAIAIKMESSGPVIFKQKRMGKNGVPFQMYKFRSMVANAEELKSKLMDANEADGPVFKIKNDPRITKVGRFIRKFSIDELPQLINVLKGDMSLIGPRPPLAEEVETYTDYQWRRLDVRPGITGLWQVSGRSDLSFEEWVNLDIYYIENWTISLDVKILLRTIPVVLKAKGAY